jgi:hypothetical protein
MISSHHKFDDSKYWKFERNSGLPLGYFDEPSRADAVVVGVSLLCLVVALVVAFL